jgi:hypothetical protein
MTQSKQAVSSDSTTTSDESVDGAVTADAEGEQSAGQNADDEDETGDSDILDDVVSEFEELSQEEGAE